MKKTIVSTFSFLLLASFNTQSMTLVGVPDPLSGHNPRHLQKNLALPTVGTKISEPSFGLGLTRATNAGVVGARHEYSRFDPFNKDQSKIILNSDGGRANVYNTQTYPYNGAGNFVTRLPIVEARWDRNNTDKVWGFSGSSIQTVDLSSSTPMVTVVKDFSKNTYLTKKLGYRDFSITMKDEGEASYDNRYWAFMVKEKGGLKRQHIVSWDKDGASNSQGGVLGTYKLTDREKDTLDWVGMSPKGNYVLAGGLDYAANEANQKITGLTMASKNFDRFHRLDYTTAHSDVGLDSHGNEIIVMQNTRTDNVDLIPIDWNTKAIKNSSEGYEGTNRTKLMSLFYSDSSSEGFKGGVHISGNYDGYALISTTIDPGDPEQNWLDRSIVMVKLDQDNPETNFLSKIYNSTDSYWEETHGTISNDGKKVVWAANWDLDQGSKDSDYNNFLLELDLTGVGIPEVAAVPIPSALVLMGSGLLGLFGISRRQKDE